MHILIADAGGTKTDWCLSDGGNIVDRISTEGINPYHQTDSDIEATVRGMVDLAAKRSSLCIDAIRFYGSGCDIKMSVKMKNTLSKLLRCDDVEVGSDLLGAARALCQTEEGLVAILGTGSNSCYYDGNTIVDNVFPLGYILGDEGSGAVLGILFLNALFKRRLPNKVEHDFKSAYHCDYSDVLKNVYREPMANKFLASLSPFIKDHIEIEEVRNIVKYNFRNFFANNVSVYGKKSFTINAVGSIAWNYDTILREVAREEGYEVGKIMASPMEGLVDFHKK